MSLRTAESYMREAGIHLEERLLDFSNEEAWPTARLMDSVISDRESLQLQKDNPDRAAAIGRRIAQKETKGI